MGPLRPGEAVPVRPGNSVFDLGRASSASPGATVRPSLPGSQPLIRSGAVLRGAAPGLARTPDNTMKDKPTTTRRRVCQALIALALVALVIAQGLLESSQGLTPNH